MTNERPQMDGRGFIGQMKPIELLQTGKASEVSLDHDLGVDDRSTGYDVVLWIEEAVFTKGFKLPIIKVHSANSSARHKMELGINRIIKFSAE